MENVETPRHASEGPDSDDTGPTAPPIRLLLLPDAADAEGGPRPALLLPNPGHGKPLLRAFPTLAAALAAKRTMEAVQ